MNWMRQFNRSGISSMRCGSREIHRSAGVYGTNNGSGYELLQA